MKNRTTSLVIALAFSLIATAQTDRQYIRDGNKLYRQKDFAEAEVMYRKALAANEDNATAMYNLACALMMQQKDSAAIESYEKASKMEKNPTRRSKIHHNIGVICQNHSMYDEAINAYKQSLRDNPSDDETRYNLALCQKLRKENNQDNKQNQQDKQQQQQQQQQQQNQDKDKQDRQQQQQPQQDQMSKENAEQLLEAAIQNEKATQQRINKATQQQSRRKVEKNW